MVFVCVCVFAYKPLLWSSCDTSTCFARKGLKTRVCVYIYIYARVLHQCTCGRKSTKRCRHMACCISPLSTLIKELLMIMSKNEMTNIIISQWTITSFIAQSHAGSKHYHRLLLRKYPSDSPGQSYIHVLLLIPTNTNDNLLERINNTTCMNSSITTCKKGERKRSVCK